MGIVYFNQLSGHGLSQILRSSTLEAPSPLGGSFIIIIIIIIIIMWVIR